jgi:catechol 2,3-dioxygenase-like lactoylglutathione lyase family enzyme
MSTNPVRGKETISKASAATSDMKFEIVVIPVADVDRAKEFYGKLGRRLDADYDSGKDFRVIQFTPPGSGCSIIFGKNVTPAAPGSAQGLYLIVSSIQAARKELLERGIEVSEVSTTPPACTRAPTSPTCLDGSASLVLMPSIAATGPSLPFVIRTATAGCSRKSPRGCPVASTLQPRPSRPRTI